MITIFHEVEYEILAILHTWLTISKQRLWIYSCWTILDGSTGILLYFEAHGESGTTIFVEIYSKPFK